ncbi:MAG: hypothetical protein LBS90_03935 [Oscillospiraceae bacterium]|jgi:hypothetical protein|nr:hypothetical protein [Oscillospiraceae bacterium]
MPADDGKDFGANGTPPEMRRLAEDPDQWVTGDSPECEVRVFKNKAGTWLVALRMSVGFQKYITETTGAAGVDIVVPGDGGHPEYRHRGYYADSPVPIEQVIPVESLPFVPYFRLCGVKEARRPETGEPPEERRWTNEKLQAMTKFAENDSEFSARQTALLAEFEEFWEARQKQRRGES